MIHNSNELTRRTLCFPAVQPNESVSETTLVNSLICLSQQICNFKPPHFVFTSNKRNAKNALRLIHVLQIFLEGVRDVGGFNKVGRSVISPLLDLHVALQKLKFLLQDCTRHDARVWMLMKYNSAGRHFRALFGSMAASLDELPLDVVISNCDDDEVKELGMFLIQKVKKAHFEAQREDVWASNLVKSALYRFESRVIPDPGELRWVMDYLGIKKWADCNNEVKFLEEEIGFGSGPAARLMGLMVYCRCVLFNRIDYNVTRVESNKCYYNTSCLNPDDIKCPISLENMVDPVTISTGHTYDRVNIVKWFKSGNPVCPKTGQRVKSLDLVPNLALKEVIKLYCLENGVTFIIPKDKGVSKNKSNTNDVVVLAEEEATKMVAGFLSLKLAMGTMEEKSKAAYEIRLLTKMSGYNRACFMESEAIPYLLNLLLTKDSTAQENSMGALLNLSKHPKIKPVIATNEGLILVVRVLKNGINMVARQHAAATLFYLSSVEEYRGLIGNNPDAIPALVELIRVGGDQGKKNALVTIFSLLMHPSNHCKVLEAKLVPLLISLLGTIEISDDDVVVDFLAVLTSLAEKPQGARAILRANKALDVIIRLLCSYSSYMSRLIVKEHCVSLLLAMCMNCGKEVVEVLVMNTSLMGALYSLYGEGISRASKKISSLISILHEFSERSSSSSSSTRSLPNALLHGNFIHVW